MLGLYFTGSGNTEYIVKRFCASIGGGEFMSLTVDAAREAILRHDKIVIGYPIYFSTLPRVVSIFLSQNAAAFSGKEVYVIATQGVFSGDGAGLAARILKKAGAIIAGGLHINMPNNISDGRAMMQNDENIQNIIAAANKKCDTASAAYLAGQKSYEGLGLLGRMAGYFCQRMFFGHKTKKYTTVKIDRQKCVSCGLCVGACSMQNLELSGGEIMQYSRCTMCYHCINCCPTKAITLLGKQVHKQYSINRYVNNERQLREKLNAVKDDNLPITM